MVTIATFDQAPKARFAEGLLKEAGIQATVTDEAIIAADWLLSNAVGWIKLMVWEEDAERAGRILDHEFGTDGEPLAPVDEDELAAEAEAAGREGAGEEPTSVPPPAAPVVAAAADENPEPYSRDEYARRLFATAYLGLAFPPVSFYALYLFLNAAFGTGELSARGRYNLFVGGMMTAPWPLLFLLSLLYLGTR